MTTPLLPKSYKRAFPFTICTTSYIYPAPIVPNIQRLAPYLDEVELLLFESRHLPSSGEIQAMGRVAAKTGLTFNIHLPLDLSIGHPLESMRNQSVDSIKEVMDVTAPLSPTSYCLHLDLIPDAPAPEDLRIWKERCSETLAAIEKWRGDLCGIVVENLSYPLEWIEELIEAFDLSVCLDVGHLFRFGFDAEGTHAKFKDRISMMHLHGVEGDADHLGLNRMSAARWETTATFLAGFTGAVSIEVFAFDPLVDSMAVLERWKSGF